MTYAIIALKVCLKTLETYSVVGPNSALPIMALQGRCFEQLSYHATGFFYAGSLTPFSFV
jgi:hypothetical protein